MPPREIDPKTGIDLTIGRALHRLNVDERWRSHMANSYRWADAPLSKDQSHLLAFLADLAAIEPDLIVVGDLAVAAHGATPRTLLLEVVLPPLWNGGELSNLLRSVRAIHRRDGSPLTDLVIHGGCLRLMTDAGPIDLLSQGITTRGNVDVSESDTVQLGLTAVRVASKPQLLAMLRAGGWSKAVPLITELEKLIARENANPTPN